MVVMKRQAYEVAAEIEKKWKSRYGCQCWSWGHHLIQWLLDRWKFKNPQDVERREFIAGVIRQSLVDRFRLGLPLGWLYVSNVHIREMMVGAGLNVSEPVRKPAIVHDRVIVLKPRETGVASCKSEPANTSPA